MRSQEPINNTSRSLNGEFTDCQPRKRGGFLGKFGRHDSKDDSSSEVDKPEPQTFTLGSQLKATVFNSWINVLFIAAPVGSMLPAFRSLVVRVCVLTADLDSCAACRQSQRRRCLRGKLYCHHAC